jgi:hypothetical protein
VVGSQTNALQSDRAIVVVQEPGDERQQDLGLLPLQAEIRLADDQFSALPVEFTVRVGSRVRLGQGSRIEEERGRRLEADALEERSDTPG